ncbi:MAG TPA: RNA pseudouridine synthase [Desulfobulbaceae bacterium]|nr:MAG: hypothetical protein A2520_00375 [Deltaproteobacteria bacterium RIFOXYD12_FULL_53_23]HCC55499.1 RNA pseudouridine synthase [Desulfobulbaceae bacterium]
MMQRKTSIIIQPPNAGQRLIDFVSQRFDYLSREQWLVELAAERFLLNHAPVRAADHLLTPGDQLVYLMPVLIEPPVARNYVLLYEDADLLVIDKPAPLPCHPGGRFFSHTLWALLKENHGLTELRFINRLDRETSGLVLVAKNKAVARNCQAQFVERRVEKLYLVVVEGSFPATPNPVEATGWLGSDQDSVIRKKTRFFHSQSEAPIGAVEASTSFKRIESINGLSLLEARPHTGRCHQIRASLLHLGFPVTGDKLYGLDEQFFLRFQEDSLSVADHARLRLPRQALHAASLRLSHPASGQELEFSAPLPPELRGLLTG